MYLSQVPYTGFDGGLVGKIFYWTLLGLWSAFIAYLFAVEKIWKKIVYAVSPDSARHEYDTADVRVDDSRGEAASGTYAELEPLLRSDDVPANLPTGVGAPSVYAYADMRPRIPEREVAVETPLEGAIERTFHETGTLVSREAITLLAREGENVLESVSDIANRAKGLYPREDGWVHLNKERLANLRSLGNYASAPSVDAVRRDTSVMSTETDAPALLLSWVAAGESEKAFSFLRSSAAQGRSITELFSASACALDDLYRFRVERVGTPSRGLTERFASWGDRDIEELAGIFAGGTDYSYSSAHIGAKLTLTKAFEFVRRRTGR